MTINEKLYKIRTDLGLSQKDFADKVGTSQSAINYWENGKRQPRMAQIKKIASAFKLPLYALTDDDFEIWDLSNELENNRARFINPSNPTKCPMPARFTAPAHNEYSTNADNEQARFEWITERINCGKELTPEESEFRMYYLEKIIKNVGELFAKPYSLLNEEGKKEADKQIDQALKQVILLTKIPEYQKKNEE